MIRVLIFDSFELKNNFNLRDFVGVREVHVSKITGNFAIILNRLTYEKIYYEYSTCRLDLSSVRIKYIFMKKVYW